VRRIGTTIFTLTAVLVAAAAVARADAGPVATAFTAGVTPGATPTDIATGPDGNLWFTETAGPGRIGRITPTGQVTEFTAGLTPKAQPTGIVAGPDGALWFTERAAGKIGRIAVDGRIAEFPLPGSQPFGIAAGPDGALYFTDRSDHVGRLTTDGRVAMFDTRNGASPEEIVAGPDGNLWFTEKAGVGRLTPGGAVTEFTAGFAADDKPADIAAGPDGNLWLTNDNSGEILRVTPQGTLSRFSAGLAANAKPAGIVRGADGALWFAENATPAVGRIDTQGRITQFVLPSAVRAWRLAAGPDGALWLTDRALPGGIVRFGSPAAGAGTGGGGSSTPVAKLGRQVVVHPVRGTVRVRRPNGRGFEPLRQGAAIAVGSLVDTRRGAVRLTSALDAAGHIQSGVFSAGLFKVTQGRRGMTDLYLRGGGFARCRAGRARTAVASAARPRRRTVRWLWGRDHSGRFRTHGRDSVATVRGTKWLTADRCDGTLTVVKSGAVSVRDRRTHRVVVVRAGGRHLARRHG